MKRIAFVGCENSHANAFISYIKENNLDFEIVGVHSEYPEAAKALADKFGVNILENYDSAVGKIDGLINTARHGANHYKYCKPYINDNIPMFVDKPITISEEEAVEFMTILKDKGIKVCGGSSLKHDDVVIDLKEKAKEGKTIGGIVRAPIDMVNEYGGFFFYAQHLVEMLITVFGRYPTSVKAFDKNDGITVVFRYPDFDVTGFFAKGSYTYHIERFTMEGVQGGTTGFSPNWYSREFEEFNAILNGEEMEMSYKDFIAPVFILNAINRSLNSGNEEQVKEYEV